MADLWYPGGVMRPAAEHLWGRSWSYLEKSVIHVTVQPGHALGYRSPTNYYGHTSFPNQTLCVVDRRWVIAKHIPNNRASRALQNLRGGVETNNDFCDQTEIACNPLRSGDDLPDEAYEVYAEFLAWLHGELDLPLQSSVSFRYGYGVAPRLSGPAYDAYRGLLGHQHVPENDHWDPGVFDVQKVIALAKGGVVTTEGEALMAVLEGLDLNLSVDKNAWNALKFDVLQLLLSQAGMWIHPNETAYELDKKTKRSAADRYANIKAALGGFQGVTKTGNPDGTPDYIIGKLTARALCEQKKRV